MEIYEIDSRFKEIATEDYFLLDEFELRTIEEYWEALKPQTIQGHAIEGHQAFRKKDVRLRWVSKSLDLATEEEFLEGSIYDNREKLREERRKCKGTSTRFSPIGEDRKYPNATFYDVCRALEQDPKEVASTRQEFIDGVFKFVHRIALRESTDSYKERTKRPLCGILGLPKPKTDDDLKSFLNGVYFAYCMDNFNPWRTRVYEKHKIAMGGGEIYLGNLENIKNSGMTIDQLATQEHSDEDIYNLLQLGLISEEGPTDELHGSVYIRRKKGGGSIDDLAIIIATLMWGQHGGIGLMLNDAIDTLDKFVPYVTKNGQDELLGKKVADLMPELTKRFKGSYSIPDDDLIVDMMSVIAGHNYSGHSHSSQRYLNQIDPQTNQTAFEAHMKFSTGQTYAQMFLSHPSLKQTNKKLYMQFRVKFKERFPDMAEKVDVLDYRIKKSDKAYLDSIGFTLDDLKNP